MRTIVCFGDSNTHGSDPATGRRFPRDVRWPGVLRAALGAGYDVIEEGLGGRTTAHDDPYSEGRNGAAYLLPCLWSHQPIDLLVLMLGTNDLKSMFHLSATEIANGARMLVHMARGSFSGPEGSPPRILLVAPAPLGATTAGSEVRGFADGVARSRRLSELYRLVAEVEGISFVDAGSVAEVSPVDGVHLDAAAHKSLGQAVAEQVVRILGNP